MLKKWKSLIELRKCRLTAPELKVLHSEIRYGYGSIFHFEEKWDRRGEPYYRIYDLWNGSDCSFDFSPDIFHRNFEIIKEENTNG